MQSLRFSLTKDNGHDAFEIILVSLGGVPYSGHGCSPAAKLVLVPAATFLCGGGFRRAPLGSAVE